MNDNIPIAYAVPADSSFPPTPPHPPSGGGPDKPPPAAPMASALPHVEIDEVAVRQFLSARFWPTGLQNVLLKGLAKAPMRFMIIDDSGSMSANVSA